MFERLLHKNNSQAKIVKWEFEVKEGWLQYRSLSSHLITSEKEFVHPGEMAKWMESGCWCQYALILRAPRVHSNWDRAAMYSM
jgi:hypothetical protein